MAQVAVLGAGMVGICTALALQERGHECLVVDRTGAGSETSYGNAGIIQSEAVEPYSLPANPWALFRLALGWKNAVALHWTSLPRQIPDLYSYWRSSAPKFLNNVLPLWSELIGEALSSHKALIQAAQADHFIQTSGYWEVHRTEPGLQSAIAEAERRRQRYGIEFRVASSNALSVAEPELNAKFAGAIHWTSPLTCTAPGELVKAYARLFERRGGKIVKGDAFSLTEDKNGWQVVGEEAEHVVVALGPWSPDLLKTLSYRIPMVRKRGYHVHFKGTRGPSRPMLLADHSIVLSPMLKGLRIATGAELSGHAQPADFPRQLARGKAVVRTMFSIDEQVEPTPWSGIRPCLPGMLPLVCKAPRHSRLWFNFGHGHQGFTLGPVTAARLARAFDGETRAIAGLDTGIH